jgi:hypothetical protein
MVSTQPAFGIATRQDLRAFGADGTDSAESRRRNVTAL